MAAQHVNEAKLRELILYIADRMEMDDHTGRGWVKLTKLLWMSDFAAYLQVGRSITGARYVAEQLGPAPVDEAVAVRDLATSGALTQELAEGRMSIPRARRPARAELFTRDETQIVDEILDRFRASTTQELVDLSQSHPGSLLAAPGDEVPYDSVFLSTEPPPDAAVALGRELINEGKWADPLL